MYVSISEVEAAASVKKSYRVIPSPPFHSGEESHLSSTRRFWAQYRLETKRAQGHSMNINASQLSVILHLVHSKFQSHGSSTLLWPPRSLTYPDIKPTVPPSLSATFYRRRGREDVCGWERRSRCRIAPSKMLHPDRLLRHHRFWDPDHKVRSLPFSQAPCYKFPSRFPLHNSPPDQRLSPDK